MQKNNEVLEIKVIINEGVLEAVLKNNPDAKVHVEVIPLDPDYNDHPELLMYRAMLDDDESFVDCDYSQPGFDGDCSCRHYKEEMAELIAEHQGKF